MNQKFIKKWDPYKRTWVYPKDNTSFEKVKPGEVHETVNSNVKPPETVTANSSQSNTARFNAVILEALRKKAISETAAESKEKIDKIVSTKGQ